MLEKLSTKRENLLEERNKFIYIYIHVLVNFLSQVIFILLLFQLY